ncbi:hypothetical protein CS542_08565 [Pedobacter sp. IW39]|nr:hypothetical protein CS542_08565 [Pedobacter sp. IW39]
MQTSYLKNWKTLQLLKRLSAPYTRAAISGATSGHFRQGNRKSPGTVYPDVADALYRGFHQALASKG